MTECLYILKIRLGSDGQYYLTNGLCGRFRESPIHGIPWDQNVFNVYLDFSKNKRKLTLLQHLNICFSKPVNYYAVLPDSLQQFWKQQWINFGRYIPVIQYEKINGSLCEQEIDNRSPIIRYIFYSGSLLKKCSPVLPIKENVDICIDTNYKIYNS